MYNLKVADLEDAIQDLLPAETKFHLFCSCGVFLSKDVGDVETGVESWMTWREHNGATQGVWSGWLVVHHPDPS